jgi:muramoyltetrapeptide carboxypeptidase
VARSASVLARGRYTAGSVEERARDLNSCLRDPGIRAVFCARGGYGAAPLLPHLDRDALRADPKLIIGASDATALLLWALGAGVTCLHGPMPAREIQEGRFDADELLRHLMRPEPFGAVSAGGARALHPGRVEGRLVGGCLSLVAASLATPWAIETDDAILFLEDVNTRPYQIDRMWTQLEQAGRLDGVRGVVFGEMPGCVQHPDQGYELDEVLADLTRPLGVPVLAGLACGHTGGVHHPLPLGVRATLDAGRLELRLDEAVVG